MYSIDEATTIKKQIQIVCSLSAPAILAQLSSIIMQYIDAAMVGSLGASSSAAIGVVASSTWLFYGIISATCTGFSVQVAQSVGAKDFSRSRQITRQAFLIVSLLSLVFASVAMILSFYLPTLLGAAEEIKADATAYFFIFALTLPFTMLSSLGTALLECSGNMKVPSILNSLLCALDVVFNALCIFILKMGVAGAATGTLLSQIVVCALLFYFVFKKTPSLQLTKAEKWSIDSDCVRKALRISLPMAADQLALGGAQIVSTKVVAPLGTIALAANSFAVTAEAFCYMPGYGIQSAATALVGQSAGAKNSRLAKRFAWLSVILGMSVMALTGAIMYFISPLVFAFLTPVEAVRELGVKVLRIELLAEPFFAASIVSAGALRGVGDTLFCGIMNLVSMWGVRITLSILLSSRFGLTGVWIAMCVELCFRGLLFLSRLFFQKWQKL